MKRAYVIFLLCFLLLIGCSHDKSSPVSIESNLEQAMKESKIVFKNICHMEVVSDGILVFYENQNYLKAVFLRDTFSGWKLVLQGEAVSLNPEKGVSQEVSENIFIPFSYGVITNKDITQIFTTTLNGDNTKSAKIVTTEDGLRIWFVINQSIEQHQPVVFIGKSVNGEIIYKDH